MSKEELRDLFLNQRPAQILLELQPDQSTYAKKIRDNIDTTYAHVTKILDRMNNQDLINKEKNGRRNELTLTGKGVDYKEKIRTFYSEAEGDDESDE